MTLALGLVLPLALSAAAPVAPSAETRRIDNLSAIDLFALADRARAASLIDEALTLYDALAKDENADVRAEARFRKGMMLADARRYRDAALAFRALLDEQPGATRVRLELARVLASMGDEASARRELRQAQAGGLPPQVAATVGQFDQALRSRKSWGGTFELALAPDSNLNRATQARTLDTVIAPLTLSRDARARSGIGMHLAGQVYTRIGILPHLAFAPRLSGLANLYRADAFNDVAATGLLGLEWQGRRDRLSPSIGRSWRWYGGERYAQTDVLAADWLHSLGRRAQLIVSGSASRADYIRNDLQDGAIYDLSASLERAVSARTGFSVTVSGSRQTARDPGYATASGGLTLLGWRESGHTTFFASAGIRRMKGDAALFLFGEKRREWLYSARAGATFRGLAVGGLAPYARLSFERNSSTVGLYDYRRIATEFGLTRAF